MHRSRTYDDSEPISAIDWYNLVAEAVKDIRYCQKIHLSSVKLNFVQCSMLTTIFSSKLSKFWPQSLPNPLCSTDGSGSCSFRRDITSRMSDSFEIECGATNSFGALESCTHAVKEVYRVVKELEAFVLVCSAQDWWKSALFHGNVGEALAVHIHDLLWSVAALDVTLHHAKCCTVDVIDALCSRRFGEIYAEMSCSHHRANESTDKKQLISMLESLQAQFANLSNRKKRTLRVDEEYKYRISAYLLYKLKQSGPSVSFQPDHHLPEGLSIDHKDIDQSRRRLIGRGSFGQVYEASWFGMRVALKELPCGDSQLFKEEASILARLHSPFIVHLIGWSVHEEANVCYLVMELCSSNLRNHIENRSKSGPPFSLRVAVDIMLQIARGMEYLHSERVIHRDLRASNVLVNDSTVREFLDEGHVRVKLCDFGMAKAKHNSSQLFSSMKGATYWRAPEVFSVGNASEIGSTSKQSYTDKADVYSFAMTCYEILTGKIPFDGTLYKEIQEFVMRGDRPDLPSSCPSLLANYIQRCWHGDYRCRPSFKEICKVLRHVKLLLMQIEVPEDVIFQSVTTEFDCVDPSHAAHSLKGSQSGGRGFDDNILDCRSAANDVGEDTHYSDVPSSARTPRGSKMHKARSFLSLIKPTEIDPRDGILRNCIPCFITKFSLHDLRTATANFSERISDGTAGAVFRGILSDGSTVAVKVAKIQSIDDLQHFCIMAAALGNSYHVNVVRFRGYCVESDLYFLFVFDYMHNLSVDRWLIPSEQSTLARDSNVDANLSPKIMRSLNWHMRFKVALGTARAVTFLHEDCGQCVLPIGLKLSKILLDSDHEPKLNILSLTNEGRNCQYYVHKPVFDIRDSSVLVISPEALDAQQVDVYNFGVILLEMAAVGHELNLQTGLSDEGITTLMDRINLLTVKIGTGVVDPNQDILKTKGQDPDNNPNQDILKTKGQDPDENKKGKLLLHIAQWCVQSPESRPSMNQVVQILEGKSTIFRKHLN